MKPEIKKLLILNLPYLLFVYLFDKAGAAVRLSPGMDASQKILNLGEGFTAAFASAAPSFHPADLLIGIAGAVIIRLAVYLKGKNAKKYRKGIEYGSARWGTAEDIKPYIDPVFENNIPLTQTERLTMNSRPKQPKYARNKNILVIGGSGSGKTRFFVKPSLMQMHSSYVVTDPKGTVLIECGKLLQRGGYRIKVLNTINFKKSMRYNPFAYMLIVQDQVWNRVTVNRAAKKSTRYFMDEFHLLLKDEQTAAYSVEIWKRFRKWGGIPTAITQNVKDLLASREVENIFENSDFVLMLNQAAGDRAILAKQLNISPQQMSYVTHSEAGEGLLFYGNVILPFVDRFPKDTELYRVMTTKPEEVGGA